MILAEVMSVKTAESTFLFGDCASFAAALQREIGGELFTLYRDGKALHTFVEKGGEYFDVKGKGTMRSMIRSITGSLDTAGWKIKGPFTDATQPCRKSTAKKIEKAAEFIAANRKRFA
jgi:hypothetical protein